MIDTLSDVLRAIRLTGAIFFRIDASPPWVVETPSASQIGPHIMPGVDHVIEYHVITRGGCWGGIADEPAVRLQAGDIIVFPQGDPHVLSSAPGMRGEPNFEVLRSVHHGRLPVAVSVKGGGSEQAAFICGFLGCDARPFNPLLATLPRVIHLKTGGEDDVLTRLVELAVAESAERRAGGECVLSRLSELLFVEFIRRYVAQLPAEEVGWFAGLRDENIGRALQKLHERPAHDWSLEELAKACGLEVDPLRGEGLVSSLVHRLTSRLVYTRDGALLPGSAVHEAGGAAMGDDPAASVLNRHNQSWDVPNVFVTDSASFPTSPWQNPALTIMALSARAGHFIADELARRSL